MNTTTTTRNAGTGASAAGCCGGTTDLAAACRRAVTSIPPLVIRGAKCQVTGRIDWWRGSTADLDRLPELTQQLSERFGPWQNKKGKHNYTDRREFNNGAAIWFTPTGASGNTGLVVDLPGAALGEMSWPEVLDLLRTMSMGLRCTRIDLALDYLGQDIPLIALARDSAAAGQLCRCKRWKPEEEYTRTKRTAYGINFGRRGSNGSGKYMRWYDKGLETKKQPEGQWVRLEAELSGGVAQQVSPELLAANAPMSKLAGIALGCIDFRLVTGDAHLSRRKRLDWWAAVLEGIEATRVTATRKRKTLESYCGWVRRCVVNGIKDLSELSGQKVQEVFEDLATGGPCPIRKPPELNPVAAAYAQAIKIRT